jgi:arginase
MRTHGLIGVPSSAGAHYPGQEKTPATLRAAGIEDRLTGAESQSHRLWRSPLVCRVDSNTSHAERVADVRSVAGGVADYVEKIVGAQQVPLVIGGDCTITIGVVAGFVRSQPDLSLPTTGLRRFFLDALLSRRDNTDRSLARSAGENALERTVPEGTV